MPNESPPHRWSLSFGHQPITSKSAVDKCSVYFCFSKNRGAFGCPLDFFVIHLSAYAYLLPFVIKLEIYASHIQYDN